MQPSGKMRIEDARSTEAAAVADAAESDRNVSIGTDTMLLLLLLFSAITKYCLPHCQTIQEEYSTRSMQYQFVVYKMILQLSNFLNICDFRLLTMPFLARQSHL